MFLEANLSRVKNEHGKMVANVDGYDLICADNGIVTEDQGFGKQYHGRSPKTNGWEGRLWMS